MKDYYTFLSKKIFPARKKLSDPHGWAYPMEDRLNAIRLQQEQIAFGRDTEAALSSVFSAIPNVEILETKVVYEKYDRKKSAIIDHVLDIGKTILVLEQKLKDNHDSTKNTGQFDDLIEKMEGIKREHPDKTVIPVMYFLTDIQKGAKKKFTTMLSAYGGRVCYGKELFDIFFNEYSNDAWASLSEKIYALQRKTPEMLDYDTDEIIDEFTQMINSNVRVRNRVKKIISDPIMLKDVFPVISKKGRFIKEMNVAVNYGQLSLFE